MACYNPIVGYRGPVNENGKRPIVFRKPSTGTLFEQEVPCGKCVGCRLTYARHWSVRCLHEASTHEENCFVTLTYDDDHLPDNGSLEVRDLQLFMKKLRRNRERAGFFLPMKYFFAGEYGPNTYRPHYHGLLFGHDFRDKKHSVTRLGNKVYESEELNKLWKNGYASIGDVNSASAAYVARYCVKKVSEIDSVETLEEDRRFFVDKRDGVIRRKEFTIMSRNPGIGKEWYDKFKGDVYPSDEVIMNGKVYKPPRYYDNLLDKEDQGKLKLIKGKRIDALDENYRDLYKNKVREENAELNLKRLKRSL